MMHWRLGLIGFGNVGQALATLLGDVSDELKSRHGVSVAVGLVATRRAGVQVAIDGAPPGGGLNLEVPLPSKRSGQVLDASETLVAVRHAPIDLLIEMSPTEPRTAQPATSHIREAIASGRHVITANKGPVALYGPELRTQASSAGVGFRYESAVMDCLPILALRDSRFRLEHVTAFAAIPNSTSSYVLDAMAVGRSRAEAVAEAQRMGFAERDPALDLEGWDAAMKAAILAQELMGRDVRLRDVERAGLSAVADAEPRSALAAGQRMRLVARCAGPDAPVHVGPEHLHMSGFLGSVAGPSTAIVIDTQEMGQLAMTLVNPGPRQTAYAVVMDLVALTRAVRAGELRPPPPLT